MSVSVAMCTYNGGRYLEHQLETILTQTREPDEIVICDDNSTDDTQAILRRYSDDYPDLFDVSFNAQNLGVTKNFEKTIRNCTGDVIAIADQDDLWLPHKLETQLDAMATHDAGLVTHDSYLFDGDARSVEEAEIRTRLWETRYQPHQGEACLDQESAFLETVRRNFMQGASLAFDADLREYLLPIPDCWQYDYFLALVGLATTNVYDIPEPLAYYRQHDSNDLGGVLSSPVDKFVREWQRGHDEYSRRARAWELLVDRLSAISEPDTALEKSWLIENVGVYLEYIGERADIHDTTASRTERLASWARNNLNYRHSRLGHPVYSLTDLTGLFK